MGVYCNTLQPNFGHIQALPDYKLVKQCNTFEDITIYLTHMIDAQLLDNKILRKTSNYFVI